MISEKDYFKLIKKVPFYRTSPGLTNNIVQKCGITKDKSKGARFICADLIYGTACCGIIAIIITFGFLSYRAESGVNTRLASNSVALADQLAYGAKVVFTGQK